MSEPLTRYFLKHVAEPAVYAVAGDEDGNLLGALDVSDEHTKGGLCPHMIDALPLEGRIDDLDYLRANAGSFEPYVPECGNLHHNMSDLVILEREYVEAVGKFSASEAETKTLRKDMEAKSSKVHALLSKIADRPALPLFEASGV